MGGEGHEDLLHKEPPQPFTHVHTVFHATVAYGCSVGAFTLAGESEKPLCLSLNLWLLTREVPGSAVHRDCKKQFSPCTVIKLM